LVATDPAPFLSTVILANAALVGIVGGLLAGRIVSIVSDQQGSQNVLKDARGRLARAYKRQEEAYDDLLGWRARDFLAHERVLALIDPDNPYRTEPVELGQLVESGLTDDELNRLVEKLHAEFKSARAALGTERVASAIREGHAKEAAEALGQRDKPHWPQVWRHVYIEIATGEDIRKRRAAEEAQRLSREEKLRRELAELQKPELLALPANPAKEVDGFLRRRKWIAPRTGAGETEARRYDQLAAADLRARQRVEDLEGEARRLEDARRRIVRPGALALWAGGAILVIFAIAGVLFPMWVMSTGPTDLSDMRVRWTLYTSVIGLAALLCYIVLYLFVLTRKQREDAEANDERVRDVPDSAAGQGAEEHPAT
jgi:hypothetical protein